MDRWRVGSKGASGRKRDGDGQAKVGGTMSAKDEARRDEQPVRPHHAHGQDTRPDHRYSVTVDVVQVNIYPRDLD